MCRYCDPEFEIKEEEKDKFIKEKIKEIAYSSVLKGGIVVKEIKTYRVL